MSRLVYQTARKMKTVAKKVIKFYVYKARVRFYAQGHANPTQREIYLIRTSEKTKWEELGSEQDAKSIAQKLYWVFCSSLAMLKHDPSEVLEGEDDQASKELTLFDFRMEFSDQYKVESNNAGISTTILGGIKVNSLPIKFSFLPRQTYCFVPMDENDIQKFFDALLEFYAK